MNRRSFLSTVGRASAVTSTAILAGQALGADRPHPRLRIGQIGTGHAHADGKLAVLRRSSDFEIVGVVEPDERLRRAAQARKEYEGVRWLTEEELFQFSGLQAVAVETEVKDLLAVAQRCVSAGLHVHLDKPAGESLPRYRLLLEQAAKRQRIVQMGYMFRYNPAFEFCFQAAREGWLGKIFSIESVIGKASAASERNKLLPYHGGTMFELGCHLIDAVVTLLGKPQHVSPHKRHSGNFPDDLLDNQIAVLEYPNALVTVRSSLIEISGTNRRQFVVCGDEGTLDIRPLEPPAARLALNQPRGDFKRGYQDVKFNALPRYAADFADLARVIRGEKAFDWSHEHDLAVQETVLRASGLPTD